MKAIGKQIKESLIDQGTGAVALEQVVKELEESCWLLLTWHGVEDSLSELDRGRTVSAR